MQKDIKKYGKHNFYREILFLALDNEELEEIEEFLIETENAIQKDDYYLTQSEKAHAGRSPSLDMG